MTPLISATRCDENTSQLHCRRARKLDRILPVCALKLQLIINLVVLLEIAGLSGGIQPYAVLNLPISWYGCSNPYATEKLRQLVILVF